MLVLHVSKTPIAGAPYLTSQLMSKYLPGIQSRCLQSTNRYADGRAFDYDLLFTARRNWIDIAKKADCFVFHNKVDETVMQFTKGKRKVLVVHSQPELIDMKGWTKVHAVALVAQDHDRYYRGKNFSLVPNMIDIHDVLYSPLATRRKDICVVGHAPSNQKVYSKGCFNYRDNKGTLIVEKAIAEAKFPILYKKWSGVPLEKLLAERRQCNTFIPSLGNPGYHRSDLEACAHGQLTINSADELSCKAMKYIAGTSTVPFISIGNSSLLGLLEQASKEQAWREETGMDARKWIECFWEPTTLLKKWWLPLLTGEGIELYK